MAHLRGLILGWVVVRWGTQRMMVVVVVSPPFRAEEISNGDRLVAMWARSAGADPAAEQVTVGAALLAEIAGRALGALVDDGRPRRAGRESRQWGRVTLAPGGLAAGVRAEAAAADRVEAVPTDGAGYR